MTPFRLYSWDAPFLPALLRDMVQLTDGKLGRAVLIMPHNRPRRYLLELLKQDTSLPRPLLLPRMVTLQELVAEYRAQDTQSPLHSALLLDRVALLHTCVHALAQKDDRLHARLSRMDMAAFLPWGIRLSSLMEECFTHGVEARDLDYTENEVAPFAAALLSTLGGIQQLYTEELRKKDWTTPGFDIREAAAHATDIPPLYQPSPTRHIFIAGFSALGEGERRLFHALWQQGAHICLHTDVHVADEGSVHWAAHDHLVWRQNWGAAAQIITPDSPRHTREVTFCEGYDLHSQLDSLREDLKCRPQESAAIVLTDNAQLMPVLHHLPSKDVNVSMGYPLERSPLFRLIENLLQLRHVRQPDGRCPWRPLLQCLRHPYLTMLGVTLPDGTELPLRDAIRAMETSMRQGRRLNNAPALCAEISMRQGHRLVDVAALFAECRTQSPVELSPLLDALLDVAFMAPEHCQTLQHMATWLQRLAELLLAYGGAIWTRFPLDAECLFRLIRNMLPSLRQSSLADTPFPFPVLHRFTTELLHAERVPFELDPITGVQVMGMLETRLLHFDTLYIVDATDDALPGNAAPDPLLPDALRVLLGLPDSRRRELVAAYTFYRLTTGASHIFLYWQKGIQRSALFDGKKSRSRFVEQYIWDMEQKNKALLMTGTPPLRQCSCTIRAVARNPEALRATPALRDAMHARLAQPLSPTLLDRYLQCPLRFAWRYLCHLHVPQEINEGDDPAAVGLLIHAVLQELYKPWLGKTIQKGDITPEALRTVFQEQLHLSGLRDMLPVDSYIMLKTAAPMRLEKFLEQQPEETFLRRLETKYTAPLPMRGVIRTLSGTIDRVDEREGGLYILDYKTGQVRAGKTDIWTDANTEYWDSLGEFCADACPEQGDALLAATAEQLHSLQLPCYIHLLASPDARIDAAADACTETRGAGSPVANAALVRLRDDGAEVPLFSHKLTNEEQERAVRLRIPDVLAFVLHHMASAEHYAPRPGGYCTFCEYRSLCLK